MSLENTFFGYETKEHATHQKTNKWDYIKIKSFCPAKETIHKEKRCPTERKTKN